MLCRLTVRKRIGIGMTILLLGTIRADAQEIAGACNAAAEAAEIRYDLPRGLLRAIGRVETGRPDPATGRTIPWPWSVDVGGTGRYFNSKNAAVRWVRAARARGVASIDAGCLQVNLMYHPNAFPTVRDAFDPARNADYAARFLVRLHALTHDWNKAAGMYHSRTETLAAPYRHRVAQTLGGATVVARPTSRARALRAAWASTLPDGKALPVWRRVALHPAATPPALVTSAR